MNYRQDAYDIGFAIGIKNGEQPDVKDIAFGYSRVALSGWADGRLQYLETSHNHLGGLVSYLLRNYEDDQWDDSTKEMFEAANAHLGNQPIEWMVDGPEEH